MLMMVAGLKTLTDPSPRPESCFAPRISPLVPTKTIAPGRSPGAVGVKVSEKEQEEGAVRLDPTGQVPLELRVKSALGMPKVSTLISLTTPLVVTGTEIAANWTGVFTAAEGRVGAPYMVEERNAHSNSSRLQLSLRNDFTPRALSEECTQ